MEGKADLDDNSRAKVKKMKPLHLSILHLSLSVFCALGILLVVYPWATYQGEFHFPWQRTLISYCIVAGLMTAFGAAAPSMIVGHLPPGGLMRDAVAFACISYLALALMVFVFSGPGLFLNIPGTRIRGIFFAEWNFALFLFYVALPFSAIAAGLWLWLRRA